MNSSDTTLVDRVLAGDRRALAQAISVIENEAGSELVHALSSEAGSAYRIGVTGSPGAGKSTLVEKMTTELRTSDKTVGVIAIDPSSAFTGGAVLGDRVRMQVHAEDAGVFIRSMATRGYLGGLTRTTDEVALVMAAAGFDVVIIETVGVGQDEVDVVRTADAVVVTLAPQLGDDVQSLKAGIMEIGDVFVINKSDLNGADRAKASVESMLALQSFSEDEWRPPVLLSVATSGQGVGDLLETIDRFRGQSMEHTSKRRRLHYKVRLREIVGRRFSEYAERDLLGPSELDDMLHRIETSDLSLYSAADEIIERALRTGKTS